MRPWRAYAALVKGRAPAPVAHRDPPVVFDRATEHTDRRCSRCPAHRLQLAMRELAEELANAHEPLSRLHSNLAEIYRHKVSELGAALRDPAHGTEALGHSA